jgi:hypothetical protein
MNIYHIWCDKTPDISDLKWVENMRAFLDHLVQEDRMISYRITRCKMGFRGIADLPEWHIMMEFTSMAQMDEAFERVVPQQGELEAKHTSFNQYIQGNIQHALYRDWPDQA